jgi:hypothetical protein
MAIGPQRLAAALADLKGLQDRGLIAIRSSDLPGATRQRLVKAGFLHKVMRGWYIPASPDEVPGDSTPWYTSFWTFIARYLDIRFRNRWCLSAEQSLALHVGDRTVPLQLLVRAPAGRNKRTALAYGTSLFELRRELPPAADLEVKDGLRMMRLPVALIHASSDMFRARPEEMRAALAMIADASELLHPLLNGGHSHIAGRLIGAFRNIGREALANDVKNAMSAAGYVVRETDPFTEKLPTLLSLRIRSPHVLRIQLNWARMRAAVLELFPPPPGLPVDRPAYLREVDEVYTTDAYHSLSIEGYRVSAELIERVRAGDWNPAMREADRRDQNALAARGYWQAFQEVKRSLEKILAGESAGATVHRDHGGWYREMFAPQVAAQIVEPATLAGYRNGPVFIRRSRHLPPSVEAVRDLMPTFFELLEQEQEPAVRVVLGHFFFVFIHPYMDGNGRMGRFLMNAMLASGGYPWRVVPLAGRAAYMAALESASTEAEIRPFARFLANLVTAPNVAAPA